MISQLGIGLVFDDAGLAVNLDLVATAQGVWCGSRSLFPFSRFVDLLDDFRGTFDTPTDGIDDGFVIGGWEFEVEFLERVFDLLEEDIVIFEEVIAD